MTIARYSIPVVTDENGDAEAYSLEISGKVLSLAYIKTDFADGVDFTITAEATGQGIWTESNVDAGKTVAPRQPIHDQVGAVSLFAALGEPVLDYIALAGDRVKVVVANGGDTKSGEFILTVEVPDRTALSV